MAVRLDKPGEKMYPKKEAARGLAWQDRKTTATDQEPVPKLKRAMEGKDMRLKEMEVKRIAPGALSSILYFQLKHIYHTDQQDFVVMFDAKQQILYVNQSIPEEEAQKFFICASYPGCGINDRDCPIADVVAYVYEKYGQNVWSILLDAYRSRRDRMADARVEEQADRILPLIEKELRHEVDGDAPDVFNEELVYCMFCAGNKVGRQTVRNLTGYGTKYVFYLGYLMGAGRIRGEEILDEEAMVRGDNQKPF